MKNEDWKTVKEVAKANDDCTVQNIHDLIRRKGWRTIRRKNRVFVFMPDFRAWYQGIHQRSSDAA